VLPSCFLTASEHTVSIFITSLQPLVNKTSLSVNFAANKTEKADSQLFGAHQGRNFVVKCEGDSLVWSQYFHRVGAEAKLYKYRFPILFFRGVLKATLTIYQSCQLECTKPWTALVACAYHSYNRTQWCRRQGYKVQAHRQMFWFVEDPGKISETLGKIPTNPVKNGAQH